VQWNLTLSAGDAPGRYLQLPGHPSLGSSGRLGEVSEVRLVDEWLALEARLSWSPGAELAWGPVETVSVSEAGFERIYQGLALLLTWPLGGDRRDLSMELSVEAR
jgi:alpha-amylase